MKSKKPRPLRRWSTRASWIALGAGGDYPAAIRALRGASGVYVIRERRLFGSPRIAYVGESHTGRLYQTLTRHFQRWSGPTSGATFDRGDVDVAVWVTSPGTALARQNALIRRYRPTENEVGLEEVPF